jgi:hypothetical protein
MNPESTAIVETTSDWKNLCSSDDRALLLKNDCKCVGFPPHGGVD